MKRIIGMAMLAACFFITSHGTSQAQTTAKHHMKHMRIKRASSTRQTNATQDLSGTGNGTVNTQSTTDPLYLNHPYFNGEPRWSHKDSLYKHGDFPWAMVNKAGSGYSFNATTGKWEQTGTMGTTTPGR